MTPKKMKKRYWQYRKPLVASERVAIKAQTGSETIQLLKAAGVK